MSTFNSAAATIIKVTVNGAAAPGPISIPGLEVGDILMMTSPNGFITYMEPIVSVADELQQLENLDFSSINFTFYLLRGV